MGHGDTSCSLWAPNVGGGGGTGHAATRPGRGLDGLHGKFHAVVRHPGLKAGELFLLQLPVGVASTTGGVVLGLEVI